MTRFPTTFFRKSLGEPVWVPVGGAGRSRAGGGWDGGDAELIVGANQGDDQWARSAKC